MAKALIRVKEILSPFRGEFRGYRLLAAEPNMAGQAFGQECPSFEPPFLIDSFGDYEDEEHLIRAIGPAVAALSARGYDELVKA